MKRFFPYLTSIFHLFLFGNLFMFFGCGLISNPKTAPESIQATELQGEWQITMGSLEKMKADKIYRLKKISTDDFSLVLKSDGTCYYKGYWAFRFEDDYLMSEGKWRLEKVIAEGEIKSSYKVYLELEPQKNNFVTASFDLVEENNQLQLVQNLGDPDDNIFVEFQKKSESK